MIYIAAPFFTDAQLNFVKEIEAALDEENIPYFSPRSYGILKDMDIEEKEKRMKDIFDKNITEIEAADIMIAVIDDRDSGTIFEIGFAHAIYIDNIYTITNHDHNLNVMLRFATNGHFDKISELVNCIQLRPYKEATLKGVH